jgi:hypothetical protein
VGLPQPGWRILGALSIGIGTGLYSASAQPGLLVLAFAPAVVAIGVIAVQSTIPRPDIAEMKREEVRHG